MEILLTLRAHRLLCMLLRKSTAVVMRRRPVVSPALCTRHRLHAHRLRMTRTTMRGTQARIHLWGHSNSSIRSLTIMLPRAPVDQYNTRPSRIKIRLNHSSPERHITRHLSCVGILNTSPVHRRVRQSRTRLGMCNRLLTLPCRQLDRRITSSPAGLRLSPTITSSSSPPLRHPHTHR